MHRLTAALAFFIHLSPFYDSEIKPLLEVLQIKEVLRSKLVVDLGKLEIDSADIRSLIKEVSDKLCV